MQGYNGMMDCYDVNLKFRRHQMLLQHPGFEAAERMLEDEAKIWRVTESFRPDVMVRLAAQTGVRHNLDHAPASDSKVIEAVHKLGVEHLLMALTSSVFGADEEMPVVKTDSTGTRLTIYTAIRRALSAWGTAKPISGICGDDV